MNAEQKLIYQIALTQIPNVGDVLAKNLVSYCGGVEAVFKEKKAKLLRVPGIGEFTADSICNFKNFEKSEEELKFIQKHKIIPLFYLDEAYPFRLKEIADAPCLLYYLGNADLNNTKVVSIVGTRKASEYGKSFTENLIEELADQNCLILSGLALGIDGYAHKAAVKNNLPTVGVLAHGLDRIYPSVHKKLATQMIENGGLLTDFVSGTTPDAVNFPSRNRIVAGMCDVLVVVETAIKGGSRITAEIANSYNKDIMALPGRVNDEYSTGCNHLIRVNKASVITCAKDLLELMNWQYSSIDKPKQQSLPLDLESDDLQIVNYIKQKNKIGIDDISFDLQLNQSEVLMRLLQLEFKGIVRSLPGKFFEMN